MTASDPFVADMLARLAVNLRDEFAARIERLEFDAEFPTRLVICIGLLDVVQRRLLPSD